MKRKFLILSLAVFTLVCFSEVSSAQGFIKGFSLKLSGGYGTMSVGDANDLFDSNQTIFNALALYLKSEGFDTSLTGDLPHINTGIDLAAEFIAHLTDNLGIGIGFGYMKRTAEGDLTLSVPDFNVSQSWKAEPKITVYPLLLSAYYFYPIMDKMNFFFSGGLGLYIGKTSWEGSVTFSEPGLSETTTDKSSFSSNAFGFHGSIGAEYQVSPNIAIFVEGKGRIATLGSLDGDQTITENGWTETNSGTIWYLEIRDVEFNLTQIGYEVSETKPDDPGYQNVRKWKVKLSGLTGIIGIRISFGGKKGEE